MNLTRQEGHAARHEPARRHAPEAPPDHPRADDRRRRRRSTRRACRSRGHARRRAWAAPRSTTASRRTATRSTCAPSSRHVKRAQGLRAAPAGHRHGRAPADGRTTAACGRSASRRTAPKPTSPSSTSALARKLGLDTVGFLMMAHMMPPEAARCAGEAHGGLRRELHLRAPTRPATCCPDDVSARVWALLRSRAYGRRRRSASTGITTWRWASPTRSPRSRRGRSASTGRPRGSAPGPATRRSRCSSPCWTAWASEHGVDVLRTHGRGRGPGRADDGCTRSASTATRSFSATPACTRPSCCSPSGAGASTACRPRDILVEMGRRKTVGGQEDMIEDVALEHGQGRAERLTRPRGV